MEHQFRRPNFLRTLQAGLRLGASVEPGRVCPTGIIRCPS